MTVACVSHADDDDNDAADDDMIVDDDSAPDDDAADDDSLDDDTNDDDSGADDDSIDDDTDDDDTLDDDDDTFLPMDVQVWVAGESNLGGVILHYQTGEVTREDTPADLDAIGNISLSSATHGLAVTLWDLLVYDGASWQIETQFPTLPEDPIFRDVLSTPSVDWVSVEGYSDFRTYLYRNSGSGWELTDTSAFPDGAVNHLLHDGQRFWAFGEAGFPTSVNYAAYYNPASNSWIPAYVVASGGFNYLLDVDYHDADFAMAAGLFVDPPYSDGALFSYNGDQWEQILVPEQYMPSSTEGMGAVSIYDDQCAYAAGIVSSYVVLSAFMIKYDHGTWNSVPEINFPGRIEKIRAMADDEYWYVGYYYDYAFMYPDYGVFRYCLDGECHTLLTAGQMNALVQLNDLVVLPVAE